MSDYMDLVKKEATAFFQENRQAYVEDDGEFGGKSGTPNLLRWLDEKGLLAKRVEEVTKAWGLKDFNWVQANTRSKGQKGGDPGGRAYASFLKDVRFVIKKIAKTNDKVLPELVGKVQAIGCNGHQNHLNKVNDTPAIAVCEKAKRQTHQRTREDGCGNQQAKLGFT